MFQVQTSHGQTSPPWSLPLQTLTGTDFQPHSLAYPFLNNFEIIELLATICKQFASQDSIWKTSIPKSSQILTTDKRFLSLSLDCKDLIVAINQIFGINFAIKGQKDNDQCCHNSSFSKLQCSLLYISSTSGQHNLPQDEITEERTRNVASLKQAQNI